MRISIQTIATQDKKYLDKNVYQKNLKMQAGYIGNRSL